jgi:hypothetical protein
MLHAAQQGKSVGVIESFLLAWSFLSRFFSCTDYTQDYTVASMKKFTEKACNKKTNKKLPFGSAEVCKIWNCIEATKLTKGNVGQLNLKDFRTFMMAVFQHKTFCRFSDLQQIQLKDVLHDVDYFKIHVTFTKTD